ncbi:sensor histidine kinase [Paenibacillus aurantiacus]|uniref:histidine kinase n=1 Tax=Paenibacillus aurantiacus TaxID=1936118 RepID=A0ABV5KWB3_9BACL
MSGKGNRAVLMPAILSAIITVVTVYFGIVLSTARDEDEEARQLALFWSRYAAQHLADNGGFEGLREALLKDAPFDPKLAEGKLAITDTNGREVAAYQGPTKAGADDHTVTLPLVMDGHVAAYVRAGVRSTHPLMDVDAWAIAGLAGTAALFAVMLLMGRYHRRNANALGELLLQAAELAQRRSAGTIYEHPSRPSLDRDLARLKQSLEDARAEMVRLETVRRSMVADISHELRTPLAVVRARLEQALASGEGMAPAQLAVVHEETLRVIKLAQDMQMLTLAEEGRLPLAKTWIDVGAFLSGIVDLMGVQAEEEGIRLELACEPRLRLHADEKRVRQVLVNLTGNAMNHARSAVEVSARLTGRFITVEIRDDGWGIEEEELPRVFERFYRGKMTPATREGAPRGLGLGLAIVKQYAEAHGGLAEVRSTWGEGTTFSVVLPVMHEVA